jgi:hypothetical protein
MASVIFPARQNLCGGSGVILPLETTRSEVGFLLPSHICQANKPYFQNLKNFVSHVITGSEDPKTKERATAAGAVAFFQKPLEHDYLLKVVRATLGDAAPKPPEFPR